MLLVGNLYAFWPFFTAQKVMRAYCDSIATGTPFADLQAQAVAQGLAVTHNADGTVRLEDPHSYGRQHCDVPVDGAGLVSAR